MSDPEDGFLAIGLSDSDDQSDAKTRESRTGQSAAAFEAVKKSYVVKIEEGEIWKGVSVPLRNPSKQQEQAAVHAVEELYFFRRFEEALGFLERALDGAEGINGEARGLLEGYGRRCKERLGSG